MKKRDIVFRRIVSLQGPSIWTYKPVLEAWIDIGELEDCPSNEIAGFPQRLAAWLPSLIEHRCSYGERGGFLRRVEEGTWPGHILEHVTLELQNLAGLPGGFGKARQTAERGVYKVVVRAWQEDVTRAALHAARDLVLAAMDDAPFDVAGSIARLTDLADRLCLGPSTQSIVDAAWQRRIPHIRLIGDGNLVQLGYGAAMRRIWTAETDQTSAIAETISRDKDLTKSLLSSCGVPIPEGREVKSPADAWEAALEIGLPVCVKPLDGNHSRGVLIDLKTREEVENAYGVAIEEGSAVLVERSLQGVEHRLLVIGGKLTAANRGDMVSVVGDGRSTVAELVERQINSDPRRGPTELHPLCLIDLTGTAGMELVRQQLTPADVPAAGREVLIRRNANHAFDVTDQVHPGTAAIAALAARIVGLDVAGIDLVCQDISRPLAEQGGAIVEVNAGPGLLMHLKPAVGTPRPVGKAIVDHLFPAGETGRIPVIGITGDKGKTAVARLLAHVLKLTGKHVGLACSDGLFLDRRQVQKSDAANWLSARRLLLNRAVETAIIENADSVILGQGLAYDRCQVGIVTGIDTGRAYADFPADDADQMFKVLRTQVDVILPSGVAVLNAGQPEVAAMADLCDGEVIFFAADANAPALAGHREKGGRAVFVREGHLVLAKGSEESRLLPVAGIPAVKGGEEPWRTANVLAAVAAAWALAVAPDLFVAGLKTYVAPGDAALPAATGKRSKKN